MTVLSFLYDLSDPQTEAFVKDNIPARYFVGFGLNQKVPDETTICRFRGRIASERFEGKLKKFFNEIITLYFYGYKSHVSYNQKTGLVTNILVSPGNAADINAVQPLIRDDRKNKIKYNVLTADRAYDSIELHGFCSKQRSEG